MPAVVIVGAQWGDEGKGKIVDLYAEAADLVVRYAGGPNAGHTLVVGDEKLVVRLVPSGVLHERARCVLAQGMVIDLAVLAAELDALARRGLTVLGRIAVSDRAHAILPYHLQVDELRERAANDAERLGTTKKGIGPAYEDKAARRGLRLGDLRDLPRARALVERALAGWAPVLRDLGGEPPTASSVIEAIRPHLELLLPLLDDTARIVDAALRRGERVVLEGAQGTLLDLDHGTYPFVTSSSAIAGGACTGAGIGPTRLDSAVGVTKAYATRVGAGPFPTELCDAVGERLRDAGREFGSVTGRPRRTGWLDLPLLRHAARVNGLDGLAVTKLDVLSGLESVRACVAYETASGRTPDPPLELLATPGAAVPVYTTLPGWSDGLGAARRLEDLPAPARALLDLVEATTGVPVVSVSVGARREETIALRPPFAP